MLFDSYKLAMIFWLNETAKLFSQSLCSYVIYPVCSTRIMQKEMT
jgi:hypothetical protein